MSYTFALVGDALEDLRDLDPWLQEDVPDELDTLAAEPTRLRPRRPSTTVVHDFTRTRAGVRHYVFLRLDRDDRRQVVRVLGIAHVAIKE